MRARRGTSFGTPEESITPSKQVRLATVARHFLQEKGYSDVDWGIDVVAVQFTPDGVLETDVTRAEALASSSVVITGVPSRAFPLVDADELAAGTIGLNFSTLRNFTDAARDAVDVYVPRVGPMTVTMVLRNATRLYQNYHAEG